MFRQTKGERQLILFVYLHKCVRMGKVKFMVLINLKHIFSSSNKWQNPLFFISNSKQHIYNKWLERISMLCSLHSYPQFLFSVIELNNYIHSSH